MRSTLLLLALAFVCAGAAVAQDAQPSALAEQDQEFVGAAASAGLLEVELGNFVASKAQTDDVKRFAQAMVRDHSKVNDEFKALLTKRGIAVPTDMKQEHREQLDSMQKLEVAELEKQYKEKMVANHKKSIEGFEKESSGGKDAELKAFASKTLPALQHHLQMAQLMAEGKQLGSLPDHDPAAAPMGESPDIGRSAGDVQPAAQEPIQESAPAAEAPVAPAEPIREPARAEEARPIQSEGHK
jgi:putative membrane protein